MIWRGLWIGGGITTMLLLWAFMGATAACQAVASKDLAGEIAKANGCIEFWLNRYQTSLQTVVSSTIGAAGLYFIIRQLRELGRQNEMTRAALEVNIAAQEAARSIERGRAVMAVNARAAQCILLIISFTNIKIFGNAYDPNSPQQKIYIEKLTAQPDLSAVYAGTQSVDLKAEWKRCEAEYVALISALMLFNIKNITPDTRYAQFNAPNVPSDPAEAATRAVQLNQSYVQLAAQIDQ